MFELIYDLLCCMLRVSGGGSFPQPLSAEEERECLKRVSQGDMQARNTLIEHNLRLVAHVIKKYYSATPRDQEDLLSVGTIGLIKAINTFKPERGTRLATYTARCIENEILMYFRSMKRTAGEVSLAEPIETDREGGMLALMDVLSCDDDLAKNLDASEDKRRLYRGIFDRLTDREREIVAMRYGILGVPEPMTQREIAKRFGISRSYASRIEKKALEKLRAEFEK